MNKNATIALIGAGNIGRRHLQGLLLSNMSFTIHVVDPFQSSLDAARNEIELLDKDHHSIFYHKRLNELPASVDIAIIATAADIRMTVLRELLSLSCTRYLILEKVLFQRLEDFEEAAQLLESKQVQAFVNCPRRYFPHYQKLHAAAFSQDWSMRVSGSNWGLACNAIHFIDLYNYLTGNTPSSFDTSNLEEQIVPSKRPGFIELNGKLQSADSKFSVECLTEEGHPITVELRNATQQIVLREGQGQIDGFACVYEALPLSKMAHLPVEQLLLNDTCDLTPYSISASLHKPFVSALMQFAKDKIDLKNGLPIT